MSVLGSSCYLSAEYLYCWLALSDYYQHCPLMRLGTNRELSLSYQYTPFFDRFCLNPASKYCWIAKKKGLKASGFKYLIFYLHSISVENLIVSPMPCWTEVWTVIFRLNIKQLIWSTPTPCKLLDQNESIEDWMIWVTDKRKNL